MPALLLASLAGPVQAGDAEAGRAKARACAMCHGETGIANHPAAPHLAGQPQVYLREELKKYRSGKREDPVMSVIAKPLSDEEIDNLAAWFSSIAIEARTP
jgi:cytochrome c553